MGNNFLLLVKRNYKNYYFRSEEVGVHFVKVQGPQIGKRNTGMKKLQVKKCFFILTLKVVASDN